MRRRRPKKQEEKALGKGKNCMDEKEDKEEDKGRRAEARMLIVTIAPDLTPTLAEAAAPMDIGRPKGSRPIA